MPDAETHVATLRRALGDAELWLPAVTGVVLRGEAEATETLLVVRPDTGLLAPPATVLAPGAEPAPAIVDAVARLTRVHTVAERLAWVHATRPLVYRNGDRARYLDLVFTLRATGGEAGADAEWHPVAALPQRVGPDHVARIRAAADPAPQTRFER